MGGKGGSSGGGFNFTYQGTHQKQDPIVPANDVFYREVNGDNPYEGFAGNVPSAPSNPGSSSFNPTGLFTTAAGTVLGLAIGDPVTGATLGYQFGESLQEGHIGDALDLRSFEEMRDALEKAGHTVGDTALAAKHGILEDTYNSLLDDDYNGLDQDTKDAIDADLDDMFDGDSGLF